MTEIHPLTPARWPDFEQLMGPRGGADGCWCMLMRQPAKAYRANRGTPNRSAMEALVAAAQEPGLIAYVDGVPSGWISIAPRDRFPRMENSKVLARVDDTPVWAITCFHIAKAARRTGLPQRMIEAAFAFAGERGAEAVEGYPIDPPPGKAYANSFAWWGYAASFERAGFIEIARRSPTRPIMRREVSVSS